MVFSRLRQHLSGSSRDFQENLVQLGETFPEEEPEKLKQALKDARGDYHEAVQSLNATQAQKSTSLMRFSPRKLQRPAHRQYINPHPNFELNNIIVHPNHQHAPSLPNNWNQNHPGHASPQYQPAFAPFPPHPAYTNPQQQYSVPTHVRSAPSTYNLQSNAPMAPSPFPSAFQAPQPQPIFPWTPSHPPLPSYEYGYTAVPLYELPPPDLMDYDMSYMVGVRMQPDWNRWREDKHWNQVRRDRYAALRGDLEEDRDMCIIM